MTSFVGRRRELAEVKRLLTQTRLLTLTGSGGAGKTRLALRAAAELARGFPDGVWLVALASIDDPQLVVNGDTSTAARLDGVDGVTTAVAPSTLDYHRGGTELITELVSSDVSSPAGQDAVRRVIDSAEGDSNVIGIGGVGPETIDFNQATYGTFPLMLSLIALLTFVLLSRALRSFVLALKAVALNLLSVAGAYGIVVIVWQLGYGSQLLWGIPATGAVTYWVPLVVFAFLYGLSMDYEVFILTRMREDYDANGSTSSAVVTGIGRTGRLVTSAALILFLAFLSMSTTPVTDIRIMATGLGAGILLDATVVRSLLVPSIVNLFGRYSRWLPKVAARALGVAPSELATETAGLS